MDWRERGPNRLRLLIALAHLPLLHTQLHTGAVTVSYGGEHTCALLQATKDVVCWGQGTFGQLGDGLSTSSPTPVKVQGLQGVVAVSAGGLHSCGVEASGTVKCWGRGREGQLGHGGYSDRADARPVPKIGFVVNVSTGGSHTCAIELGGTVRCWGQGNYGQLGLGTRLGSLYPSTVPGLTEVVSLSCGGLHTCAVQLNGAVLCWGWGDFGQLGVDQSWTASPVAVPGITSAEEVACGYQHCCVLLAPNATITCWGLEAYSRPSGVGGPQEQSNDELWGKTVQRVLTLDEALSSSDPVPTAPIRSLW